MTGAVGCDILQNMKRFFKTNRELLWLLLFAVVAGAYFSLQYLPLHHHSIHTALDDKIPFVPAFIIPYILWYVYVPGLMLAVYPRDRRRFVLQSAALFSGAFICLAIFIIYPSRIDFRPEAEGDGLLLALCRIVYAGDRPLNVFPSLHCYETCAVFLAAFGGAWRRHKLLCAVSGLLGILICLSTLFVKQHSVLDFVSGCALAVVVYLIMKSIFDLKYRKEAAHADISL